MPNPKYTAGRRLEYIAKGMLEDEGYHVQRSAGSKGIDLVAFLQRTEEVVEDKAVIRAIMITNSATKAKKAGDYNKLMSYNLPDQVSKELWVREDGGFTIYLF